MSKHWNKILALFMGVLMLLAILPVGIGTVSAEDGDNEIVITDHDVHAHDHAHDHEHEEDLDAHRNPFEPYKKAEEEDPEEQKQPDVQKESAPKEDPEAHRNPHLKEQEEEKAKKSDDLEKPEDPNAHKNPHVLAEQDQKRKPEEHELHAVGDPFVLTDGVTFTPNSDGDECPHTGTTHYGNYIEDVYEYEAEDNRYHYVYDYEVYEVVCDDCGEVIGTAREYWDRWSNEHDYQDGVCTLCGHENTCTHPDAYEDWYWVDEPNYEEIEGDHRNHQVSGNAVTYMYCEDCGMSFDESDPAPMTLQEGHYYSNESDDPLVCSGCKHNRAVYGDPLSTGESTFEITSENAIALRSFTPTATREYVFYSFGSNDTYGYIFDDELELLASNDDGGTGTNFRIRRELTAGETYWFGAKFYYNNDTGSISFAVIDTANCPHLTTTSGWYWEDEDNPQYEQIPGDDWGHNRVGNVIYYTRCEDCGTYIYESDPTYTTMRYSHAYVDSVCQQCGYTCTHSSTYENFEWTADPEFQEIKGDHVYHKVIGDGIRHTYCESCGKELGTPSTEHRELTQRHHYYSSNPLVCVDCGHSRATFDKDPLSLGNDIYLITKPSQVVLHPFTPSKTGTYAFYSTGDIDTYGYLYDSNKKLITYNDDAYNANFHINYNLTAGETYWFGARFYSSSNTGRIRVRLVNITNCKHEHTVSNWYWEHWDARTFESIDNWNHKVTGDTIDFTYCFDCDKQLSHSDPVTRTETYRHNYDYGECTDCGHVCEHPSTYNSWYWDEVSFDEIKGDNKYHKETGTQVTATYCSVCRSWISDGERIEVSDEKYTHDYEEDGICYSCGHVNTCEHKNRAEDGYWYSVSKYEDWGSKEMMRGKVVFYSRCADCNAWYTEVDDDPQDHAQKYDHEYDENGVCYYCGRKNLKFKTQPKSQTVANGKTATFTTVSKESGAKYQWYYSKNNGVKWTKMKGKTGTSISVQASATTNGYLYRCVVTAKGGTASSEVVKLTVSGVKPKITEQTKSMTVYKGNSAHFQVAGAGSDLKYQWYCSTNNGAKWTKMSGKTKAELVVKATAKTNGNLYRCVVKNAKGSVTSGKVKLTVNGVKPRITVQPKATTVASGKKATFKVVASGKDLSYQWYYSKNNGATWVKWNGKTGASIKVKASASNNGTMYRCVIMTDFGKVTTKTAKITVSNVKPRILTQPVDAEAASGKTATFKVVAAGVGLKYQWQYSKNAGKTWTNLSGKTSATFSVKVSKSNNGYLYRCVVKNTKGSVNSSAAKLTLKK